MSEYAGRLIEDLEEEIELFTGLSQGRLAADPGYVAVQQLPGVGKVLAAVFRAEIGDITRFQTAPQLACWAGLTPKHHESDTKVHRGRITKQGSRLVRWAAVESVNRLGPTQIVGAYKKRVADRRGTNIGTVAAARKQTEFVFYALRDHHVRALHRPPVGVTTRAPV
jgi:transposase